MLNTFEVNRYDPFKNRSKLLVKSHNHVINNKRRQLALKVEAVPKRREREQILTSLTLLEDSPQNKTKEQFAKYL